MIESGLNPDAKTFNMFFTKSDASISAANGVSTAAPHVSLLDYEIELALVFRRSIHGPVTITRGRLKDYVFAVTIANDISARDVQLPQMQFFKGKSYRGFCPIGPWLTVLEPQEFALLDNLDLRLSVNGVLRQSDTTANLVFKPAETISELSTFANIAPGDVLLTGTPSGCALRVPPPMIRRFCSCCPNDGSGDSSFLHSAGAPIISSPATRSRQRSAAPMDGSTSASRQQRLHNPVPSQARRSSQRGLVMMTRTALVCLGPGAAGAFEVRQTPRRNPAADEVSITVAAASVNP